MAKLNRFIGLPAAEKRLFFSAVFMMCLVRVAIVFAPLRMITRALNAANRRYARTAAPPRLELKIVAKRIAQAVRYCPLPLTCLSEALAARALLERYGYQSTVKIGVNKTEARFGAHAWLECPGGLVIGSRTSAGRSYAELPDVGRMLR